MPVAEGVAVGAGALAEAEAAEPSDGVAVAGAADGVAAIVGRGVSRSIVTVCGSAAGEAG